MGNNSQHRPIIVKPCPIIVKVSSRNEKTSCIKSAQGDTYVSEDVSKATLHIRIQKLEALKEKRDQGYINYFSGIDIITKQRNERRNYLNLATGAISVHFINKYLNTDTNPRLHFLFLHTKQMSCL